MMTEASVTGVTGAHGEVRTAPPGGRCDKLGSRRLLRYRFEALTEASPRFRRAHIVIAVMITVLTTLGAGRVVSAHTDFVSSAPTDGAVVDGPLTQVVVNFTNPAQPSGHGFELLDPTGSVRVPASVDETDGTSFVLTFDPPLEGGTYGLRWKVQAGDAHPIDGSFRFDVTGTAVTTTTTAADVASAAAGATPASTSADATSASLDEFLNAGSTGDDTARVGRIGRTVTILGTIFGVGVLAALVWIIRGRREEIDTQLAWIRLAGLVVFTGGLIELAALAETDPTTALGSLLATKAGVATVLKVAGGLAVVLGFHRRAGRIIAPT
jgi:methionine-rich copper-binding protein CopC